jgi:hypothetical protein
MEINKNDCKYLDKVFLNYLNESLSDTDKEFCKTHLNSCNDCKNKEEYQELLYVWNKLDSFNEVELPNFFMAKLQHKIAGIEEKSKLFWFRMDYIFSLLKGPMLALTFIAVNITNTVSFAEPHLYEKLRSKDTFTERKINDFKQMTVNQALESLIKLSKKAKEAN